MSDKAILCEGLSKQYRIGEQVRYRALRDVISDAAATPFRHLRGAFRNGQRGPNDHASATVPSQSTSAHEADGTIWALDDVSFEVNRGEVVGIIGRNGAGKSTLLKILSRITKPTRGHATINGRVGSLLEVGTGFHPELTGRENIFLNGAILGMRKTEIDRKFDEIVAFAEVEKFIDTPVKRYSSGMYVRLAFAVAAHMETEVLLVDEVLAVGDREFQKKCLGKLDDVSKHGRTVIMVSHQMNQVRRLCGAVIWLDSGTVRQVGPGNEIIPAYEEATTKRTLADIEVNGHSSFLSWEIEGSGNVVKDGLQPFTIVIAVRLKEPIKNGHLGIHVASSDNAMLASWAFDSLSFEPGVVELALEVPSLPLRPGVYTLACSLFKNGNNLTGGSVVDQWQASPSLIVEATELSHPQDQWSGLLNLPARLRPETRRKT